MSSNDDDANAALAAQQAAAIAQQEAAQRDARLARLAELIADLYATNQALNGQFGNAMQALRQQAGLKAPRRPRAAKPRTPRAKPGNAPRPSPGD